MVCKNRSPSTVCRTISSSWGSLVSMILAICLCKGTFLTISCTRRPLAFSLSIPNRSAAALFRLMTRSLRSTARTDSTIQEKTVSSSFLWLTMVLNLSSSCPAILSMDAARVATSRDADRRCRPDIRRLKSPRDSLSAPRFMISKGRLIFREMSRATPAAKKIITARPMPIFIRMDCRVASIAVAGTDTRRTPAIPFSPSPPALPCKGMAT